VNVSVEFVIRPADLRQAMSQLKVNRGSHKQSDFVDILVSEFAATFRSVGTETEVPVHGKRPGSLRLPLRIVDKIRQIVPSLRERNCPFTANRESSKSGLGRLTIPTSSLVEFQTSGWKSRLTFPS
jgi:hypothetical protein